MLGRSLISERQLALRTGQLFTNSPWCAHVVIGENACGVFTFNEVSSHYEMKAKRSAVTAERTMLASTHSQRDTM